MAQDYPTVRTDDEALGAARLMAEQKLPGLLVTEDDGEPAAILPASQLVRALVPGYVLEDPTLAAVIDEAHADRLCQALAGRTVGECLPPKAGPPPVAAPDDTAVEVAALMASARSPLVAVVDRDGGVPRLLGVITASHLLNRLLGVK
nr:CBS domain-containing protein [Streptomyces coryli]